MRSNGSSCRTCSYLKRYDPLGGSFLCKKNSAQGGSLDAFDDERREAGVVAESILVGVIPERAPESGILRIFSDHVCPIRFRNARKMKQDTRGSLLLGENARPIEDITASHDEDEFSFPYVHAKC